MPESCEWAIVRNEIRACLEGTMVSMEQALVALWLKTNERTFALHVEERVSRAQADFAWNRAKRDARKSMVDLAHNTCRMGQGAEHAESEIMKLRLCRINRKDPKMEQICEPRIARAALLAELKELKEAFRSGNMGDVCDEAGDVLHCTICLHAATIEHKHKGAAKWDMVTSAAQQQEGNHGLVA